MLCQLFSVSETSAAANEHGGKTALPDWEQVALNDGRDVYAVFDSDVMTKPGGVGRPWTVSKSVA